MRARTKLIVAASAAAFAAASLPASAAEPEAKGRAIVIVAPATNACFSDTLRVTGYMVPRRAAVVTVDGEGYKITEVLVAEGDQVIANQEIAKLTRQASRDPRAQAQGAQGAQAMPANITLKAPVAGLVMSSAATVGAMASPQAGPLFHIITDNEVELDVEVPSLQVPKLSPGATARITFDDGIERNGRVRMVEADIDQRTQLGHARLSVDKDPTLRVGMFARAAIDASRSCGVSVPRSAVTYQTGGTSVQVVRNNVIETRRVTLGLASDTSVEIRDGIAAGDVVVANAGTSLHDGDQVKTIAAEDSEQGRSR
jgi:multidrug efflux pump subunit AcrA (membrane-fusion protein)